VLKALGLTDHQNVFEVNLLGRRRRGRHIARLLCFYLATHYQQLRTQKNQGKEEKHPKKAHLDSLKPLRTMDDASLSAAAVTFSLGEKFIGDYEETQFFTRTAI
jgi:hypothetical protein